jgi:hypothetical protein
MKTANQTETSSCHASSVAPSPSSDEEEVEIDFDDPTIDESLLPPLDEQDAEVLTSDSGYVDLLDESWLERGAGEDDDDEGTEIDGVGFTIELNEPNTDDDGAQVVDLDVGSLLTSLPNEGTELDLDPRNDLQRGLGDGSLAIGAIRDMLLPDTDEEESDDTDVGDDDRFPAFDDASDIAPRPGRDDADDDDPIDKEDLT